MISIKEKNITFIFPDGWKAVNYDGEKNQDCSWRFFRNQFRKAFYGGVKGVDIVAFNSQDSVLCLIEIKDYRYQNTPKPSELPSKLFLKVRDTLAGLVAAQFAANDDDDKNFARNALKQMRIRLVFHLEQPKKEGRLYRMVINPTSIERELKMHLKCVDPRLKVVDSSIDAEIIFGWKVETS